MGLLEALVWFEACARRDAGKNLAVSAVHRTHIAHISALHTLKQNYSYILQYITGLYGGEGGIRTHGGVAPTPHFECGTFDHSATSPRIVVAAYWASRRSISDMFA